MSSEYPMLDQNSAADPVLGTRMESRLAYRSNSRGSASVTSCVAIPSRLPSGATASLYRFPRQPSQAAITVATILPPISAIISASLSLSRRQAILSELSVSLGRAPDNCQSSSIETASSGRPLRMLTSSPTLRATFLHNILALSSAFVIVGPSFLFRWLCPAAVQRSRTLCSAVAMTSSICPCRTCLARLRVKPLADAAGT